MYMYMYRQLWVFLANMGNHRLTSTGSCLAGSQDYLFVFAVFSPYADHMPAGRRRKCWSGRICPCADHEQDSMRNGHSWQDVRYKKVFAVAYSYIGLHFLMIHICICVWRYRSRREDPYLKQPRCRGGKDCRCRLDLKKQMAFQIGGLG